MTQENSYVTSQLLQEKAISYIRNKSCGSRPREYCEITVNFHPDHKTRNGDPILVALAKDGLLKAQFETGTSNGGLTAFAGGDRWKWEHKAFNGIYDQSPPEARPKYGTLNYKNLAEGGSPRFGSACFRLKTHVLERSTFCYPDSYFDPKEFSTFDNVTRLIDLSNASTLDKLDNYIEAHIHGNVDLKRDVETLVLDPVFKGSSIEKQAKTLPVKLAWHHGFEIPVTVVENNPDYRGHKYVKLANRIAQRGVLNPQVLGMALEQGNYDPQDIKKLWHYVARFG